MSYEHLARTGGQLLCAMRFHRAVKKANKALRKQARAIRRERCQYATDGEGLRHSRLLRGELSRVCEAVRRQCLLQNGLVESRETLKLGLPS